MTLTDLYALVTRRHWPRQPRIRAEALQGLRDAASIMKRWGWWTEPTLVS